MKVDISDSLYERCLQAMSGRAATPSMTDYVERLIRADLERSGGRDLVTGCGSRRQLEIDLESAVAERVATAQPSFVTSYLCLDINDFRGYVEMHGLVAGEELLRDLAERLGELYPDGRLYRFGGDEFVVELGAAKAQVPRLTGVVVRWSRVDVSARVDAESAEELAGVVLVYLDEGVVESTPEGISILCTYPA